MHLQAATYNNSLQQLANMLTEWKEAANEYSKKIDQANDAGKPTAGMEIYHSKQLQRIDRVEQTLLHADAYIEALHYEIERLKANAINQYTTTANHERVRIIDLPHSPDYYHNEVMNELQELKNLLTTQSINNG